MLLSTRVATGVFAIAFACVSAAGAQDAGSAGQAPQGQTQTQQPSQQQDGSSDQQVARQALQSAQQSLAELTKLPAAATLQGEPRTLVAGFISDFNAFATATTDWRSKYQTASASLNKTLEAAANAGSAPAPAEGEQAATWPPEIVEKLKDVRQHLDTFERASGDPVLMVERIERVLQAASSGGGANLTAAQLDEIREYLGKIRRAATR
ncbi:MAG TPA: hypothetical protein VF198_15300 [Vicinamibacterales bacterium]